MRKTIGKILVVLAVPLTLFGVWTQRWNIYDSARLRGYTAPDEVARLATETSMNDKTRRLFYVYHPQLNDKSTFNSNCSSSEQTIVLGCYVNGRGIYLYNVSDARLNGIMQVTAAHETLHAAYERLSSNDKAHINDLINQAYNDVQDERIHRTIDDYRKKDADINNELHSILGTEVRILPQELETYYKRYFSDRQKIVSFSEQYEKEFSDRKNRVASTDARLDELKKSIESGEAELNNREAALKAERERLDKLLADKNYSAYNAGVPGFNKMVNAYNAQVNYVRGMIDEYNALVAERNALVNEEDQLIKAIDSRPETVQTQ